MCIRNATRRDDDLIWQILEPVLRAGETYTLPPEMSREDALAYWFSPGTRFLLPKLPRRVGSLSAPTVSAPTSKAGERTWRTAVT